jgi:uncharacterized metal-binding protein YceD (DUF177 family)
MKPLKAYEIQFVGLKLGEHIYKYDIDNTFFKHFEYDEFNSVNAAVTLKLEKKTTLLELQFVVQGHVNIQCDLTNEPYNQPIAAEFNMVVKFGSEYNDDNEDILIIPHGAYEINVAQYIYELVVLSVPSKRIHPGVEDGTLNSDILETLNTLRPESAENTPSNNDIDPRWEALKKLLTDKQ